MINIKHITEVANNAIQSIDDRRNGNILALKTSLDKTNKFLDGGFEPGEILVIGGRPGTGKSAFVLKLITDFCSLPENQSLVKRGFKFIIVFWSLEMPNEQHIFRIFSGKTKLRVNDLRSTENALGDLEFNRLKEISKSFVDYPLYMSDVPVKTSQIVDWNIKYIRDNPDTKIINVVDHSRLTGDDKNKFGSEEQKITDLYVNAVGLANEFKCSFIILSQLNRNIDDLKRISSSPFPWPIPVGSDLFGSDGATQCAHKIHILVNPYSFCKMDSVDYHGKKLILKNDEKIIENRFEVLINYIVKSRFGPTGEVIYKTNLGINRIEEYVR